MYFDCFYAMGDVHDVVCDAVDEDTGGFDAFNSFDRCNHVDVEFVILQDVVSEVSLENFAEHSPEELRSSLFFFKKKNKVICQGFLLL